MRHACLIVALLTVPAAAQPPAEADKEAIVCGLTGTCDTAEPPAADAPAAEATDRPKGTPRRSGATRGFSFTRPTPSAPTGRTTPAAKAAAPNAPRRTAPGKLDLRINFVTGSAEVSPDSRARVAAFAAALLDPRLVRHRIRIEGHTDSIGTPEANLDLSNRRAEAVAGLVTARGVDRARLDVQGYGDTQTLPGTARASAANRRVVAALAD